MHHRSATLGAILTLVLVGVPIPPAHATHVPYQVEVTSEPNPLVPLSMTSTPVSLADDEVTAAFSLGFSVSFFGEGTSVFWLGSNGFITMMSIDSACGDPACQGLPIPQSGTPSAGIVAGFWTDLKPNLGGAVRFDTSTTVGGVPALVVEYNAVPGPAGPSGPLNTFQIVVRADSVIEVRIDSVAASGGKAATIGIESCEFCGRGLEGVQHLHGTGLALANTVIRFVPVRPTSDLCLSPAPRCGPLTAVRGTVSTGWFLSVVARNLGAGHIDHASVTFTATPAPGVLNAGVPPAPTTMCVVPVLNIPPGAQRTVTCAWTPVNQGVLRTGRFEFKAVAQIAGVVEDDDPSNDVATVTAFHLVNNNGGTPI